MLKTKIITATITALLAFSLSAKADEEIILQDKDKKQSSSSNQRSLTVPIRCILNEESESMDLFSCVGAINATVSIQNHYSGQSSSQQVVLSQIPIHLSLFGHGSYSVIISLESGIEFEGEFIL